MITAFIGTLYGLGREWPKREESYARLLEQIKSHAIGATVYDKLKKSGRLAETPVFFREELARVYQGCFVQNLLIKHETDNLLRRFEESGIEAIPLKGTVLAERCFGHFAARGTSDIDLLVRPGQLADAVRVVREAGYRRQEASSPVHYHNEWCKDAPGLTEPITVELHWSFVQEGVSAMDVEALWRESEPLGGYRHIRALPPEATFYTLCLHGASHQMESAKHILDLLHMLCEHGRRIDLVAVLGRASRDRTRNRVKAALAVLYMLYPELEQRKPSPVPLPLLGWPGLDTDGRTNRFSRFCYSLRMMDTPRDRLVHLSRLLFPSRKLAAYSVGEEGKAEAATYFRLYRQRLRRLFGG